MPIHAVPYVLSAGSSISLVHPRIVAACSIVFVLILVRKWANGKDLIARLHIRAQEEEEEEQRRAGKKYAAGESQSVGKSPERDLHGMTFLVSCNITASSLLILSSLSNRGAQLILLLPSSAFQEEVTSSTLQYLQLLRDGTNNEQVYAEECDLTDLKSIDKFCTKWNEGNSGPDNSSSSAGLGAGFPGGGVKGNTTDPMSNARQDQKQARRVDGLVFLPYNLNEVHRAKSSIQDEFLGRFHLINSLLSTLLLLPPERDIRIVNWISPWYAAGVQDFLDEQKASVEDGKSSAEKSKEPSRSARRRTAAAGKSKDKVDESKQADATTLTTSSQWSTSTLGSNTLTYLLLTFELQRRLILLAEADPRPRNPLPGILDSNQNNTSISSVDNLLPRSSTKKYPNINVVNICPGFERDGEASQWLLFSPTQNSATNTIWGWLISLRKLILTILIYSFLFILTRSPKSASEELTWGIVAPLNLKTGVETLLHEVEGDLQRPTSEASDVPLPLWTNEPREDEKGWKGIQPGRLYRQGQIIRLPLNNSVWLNKQTLSEVWADWEEKIEKRTGGIRRAGGHTAE
ncbi:unnamed protein product [Sympodiomycopsis kandeliae]